MLYRIKEQLRGIRVKVIKLFYPINSCPSCKYNRKSLWFVHQIFSNTWYIECPSCHWCGKSSKLMIKAVNNWNKQGV